MSYRYTIAGAILLALGTAVSAAPDTAYIPPPGLYQIELVNAPGGAAAQRAMAAAGGGAQRVCYKPNQDIAKDAVKGCTIDKKQVVAGRMIATSSCPWGQATTSMRQVDARTWETAVEMTMADGTAAGGAAGALAKKLVTRMTRVGDCKG